MEVKGETEAEVIMDEKLWKNFPEELMEAVIARLPILTLIRFRSVCKKWNSLPKSPHFQQLSTDCAPWKQPLFFKVVRVGDGDAETGALYHPSTKEWCYTNKIPPDFFQGLFCAASAGGLVCYHDWDQDSFQVGNCLTQTWKNFPWPRWTQSNGGGWDVVAGMVTLNQLQSGTGAYKIIWADSSGNYRVYDSVKDALISGGRIPANIKFPRCGFRRKTVSIDTVVYFLAREADRIISYDVVSGAWEQFLIPSPPNSSSFSLAECGGRLLLVGSVGDEDSASTSVCVWALETAMLCWKEVDWMPTSWWSEFINDDGYPVCEYVGNGRVLVMLLETGNRSWIVTYDVVNREWSKAPQITIAGRYPFIRNGVAFIPSLSVSP